MTFPRPEMRHILFFPASHMAAPAAAHSRDSALPAQKPLRTDPGEEEAKAALRHRFRGVQRHGDQCFPPGPPGMRCR